MWNLFLGDKSTKLKTKAKKELIILPIIDIGETNALQPWKAQPYKICAVCGKKAIHYTKTAQAGSPCQASKNQSNKNRICHGLPHEY